ncbi:DNA-binding protein [Pseudoroseomonas deserti]|uniref:DNA-binding protein n=1 Tax=Teichococcus deserti TaxID=1817963 RepID=A0A1V2H4B6_9PROT|nr:DUF3140 domain-containing protein [Pseudoroseomonas deserti]ONG55512.1 DNA-binding protein [Pseudoroseomonas deserti]
MTAQKDGDDSYAEFRRVVNMPPARLRKWLDSEASRSVGMTKGGEKVTKAGEGEAVGHHMGERILEIRATAKAALTEQDKADMRKVIGYVHRHLAQRPSGDVKDSRWRHSLMNWGHDPLR